MKKIVIIFMILLIFMVACSKKHIPVAPDESINTPTLTPLSAAQITQTAAALQTAGIGAQQTATAQDQQTAAATATATAAAIVATQTAAAIVATQTAVAIVATQTAVATIPYTNLASVPGGTYTQTDGTSSFSHTISTFKMGKYQVTYDLWYTVYQWAIANGYSFANAGAEGTNGIVGAAPTTAKYQPVTYINWRDSIVLCNAYSQKTGLSPVYCSDAAFTTPIKSSADGSYGSSINTTTGGFDNPYVNWNTNGFRLPTEGEWQYAASYIDGSSWTPYNYASGATAAYTNATATGLVAWYSGVYSSNCTGTQAVGGKIANALGIYDMSGNVEEWCWDWWGNYPGTSTDYRGSGSGVGRVDRGGSCYPSDSYLQVGSRSSYSPYNRYWGDGLRLARTY